jgi:hypothetical protein
VQADIRTIKSLVSFYHRRSSNHPLQQLLSALLVSSPRTISETISCLLILPRTCRCHPTVPASPASTNSTSQQAAQCQSPAVHHPSCHGAAAASIIIAFWLNNCSESSVPLIVSAICDELRAYDAAAASDAGAESRAAAACCVVATLMRCIRPSLLHSLFRFCCASSLLRPEIC